MKKWVAVLIIGMFGLFHLPSQAMEPEKTPESSWALVLWKPTPQAGLISYVQEKTQQVVLTQVVMSGLQVSSYIFPQLSALSYLYTFGQWGWGAYYGYSLAKAPLKLTYDLFIAPDPNKSRLGTIFSRDGVTAVASIAGFLFVPTALQPFLIG